MLYLLTTSYIGLTLDYKYLAIWFRLRQKMNVTAEKLTLEIINNCDHRLQVSEQLLVNLDNNLTQNNGQVSCSVIQSQYASLQVKYKHSIDIALILCGIIVVLILVLFVCICCKCNKTRKTTRSKTDKKTYKESAL